MDHLPALLLLSKWKLYLIISNSQINSDHWSIVVKEISDIKRWHEQYTWFLLIWMYISSRLNDFLTESISISIIMAKVIQLFISSYLGNTDGWRASLYYIASYKPPSSPQLWWKMRMLDGVESGGAIIWIQGQIRVARPMKLMYSVHYSATELHNRSGCHVKQRDTAAEVTHAQFTKQCFRAPFAEAWYVVVVNGCS